MYQLNVQIQGGSDTPLADVAAQLDEIKARVLAGHSDGTLTSPPVGFAFEVREVDSAYARLDLLSNA